MFRAGNKLKNLMLIYAIWIALAVFSGAMFYLYFKDAGVSYFDLALSLLFWAFSPFLLILLFNKHKLSYKSCMASAFLLMALSYFLISFLSPTKGLLFFNFFAWGLCCFLFWTPFNIEYFKLSKGQAATLGTVYFSMSALLGLFLPILSAVIAQVFGFQILFLLSGIFYALAAFSLFLIENREFKYELAGCIKENRGFKTLIFVEGIYGGGISAVLPVVTLFFFNNPIELGIFATLTTIFSVVASFVLSKLSDKAQKRKRYLTLSAIGVAATTVIASFAGSIYAWFASISARNFFATIFYPFTTAIIVDNNRDMTKIMVGREWLLNSGRVIGVLIVLFSAVFLNSIQISLAFLSIFIILYPIVLELKKRHIIIS